MGIIITKIKRPPRDVIEGFKTLPTPAIADSMNRFNVMDSEIKPIFPDIKICGPAVTVREITGCNIMIHKAVQIAQPGDVIVVNAEGYKNRSVGGYILSSAGAVKGIEAFIIDGAWRDYADIKREKLPVFARTFVPAGPHKGWGGDINVSIQCGNVQVHPGDIIVGDEDGVVVIPQDQADEILDKAREIVQKERVILEKVKKGISTVEIYGFDEKLKSLGVREL